MRRLLGAVLCSVSIGCASINTAHDYRGVRIDGGEVPLETVEVVNTSWLLFKCIPLGSGDPESPNEFGCRLFTNTATLQNNLNMLDGEMARVGAKRISNLASRKTDESLFFVLLSRQSYHTCAVLLK